MLAGSISSHIELDVMNHILVEVNGEKFLGRPFSDAIAAIRDSPRPLTLRLQPDDGKIAASIGPNYAFYCGEHKIRSHGHTDIISDLQIVPPCLTVGGSSGRGCSVLFDGTVDDFHSAFGTGSTAFCYQQLEQRHDYIQWLFPSPERSRFNSGSWPLEMAEAEAIAVSGRTSER
jgi:hypothetical protein